MAVLCIFHRRRNHGIRLLQKVILHCFNRSGSGYVNVDKLLEVSRLFMEKIPRYCSGCVRIVLPTFATPNMHTVLCLSNCKSMVVFKRGISLQPERSRYFYVLSFRISLVLSNWKYCAVPLQLKKNRVWDPTNL